MSLEMQPAREAHRAAAFDRARHSEQYTIDREPAGLDIDNCITREDFHKVSGKKYTIYKNNSAISDVLDVDPKSVRPIPNDWQDASILPNLANHLDVLPKCPGIYPTEAIT